MDKNNPEALARAVLNGETSLDELERDPEVSAAVLQDARFAFIKLRRAKEALEQDREANNNEAEALADNIIPKKKRGRPFGWRAQNGNKLKNLGIKQETHSGEAVKPETFKAPASPALEQTLRDAISIRQKEIEALQKLLDFLYPQEPFYG